MALAASPTPRAASGTEPLWTRRFVFGTLLNFFIAANYFMLMVVMTAYALDVYQAPAAVAAFCASSFIVGTLFSRFLSAPLMDRFGRMSILVVGVVAEVALTALYLLDEPVGGLIGVRFVHGFSYGLCSTTVATIITSIVPAARKGEGIGYFMLSITLGSAIGPFAGIFLSNNFGYDALFVAASVLVALAVPCTLLLRPAREEKGMQVGKVPAEGAPARGETLRGRAEVDGPAPVGIGAGTGGDVDRCAAVDALASDGPVCEGRVASAAGAMMREKASRNRVEADVRVPVSAEDGIDECVVCDAPASNERVREERAADAVRAASRKVASPAAARARAVGSASDFASSARVPSTRLEARIIAKVEHSALSRFVEAGVLSISVVCGLLFFGYSSLLTFLTPYANELGLGRAASVFFVVYALAMFVTRPFTGRAFDRKGPHPVMVPAFVSFATGMVVVAFMSNDWMLLGAALLLGFGVGTVQSCGLAMAVRDTSDARLSVANATFYMLLDVGVGVGPIILGLIVPLVGYQVLYLCMAAVGTCALVLFLIVAKTEKGTR